MSTAFTTALSGLNASATAVDVVGNNLANLSTTGFKASDVSFHDLVAASFGGATETGFGTAAQTVRRFAQGGVQASGGTLDAAIEGDGFFVVKNQSGNTLFTRAGNFSVDAAGTLITSTKEHVQGWLANNIGVLSTNGPPGDIVLPTGTLRAPVATTNMSLDMNLDSSATVGAASGTFSQPIQIVDSLGSTHAVTVAFTKTGANAWSYNISIPSADLAAGAGTTTTLTSGNLTFDSSGRLATPTLANGSIAVAVTGLKDAAADMSMKYNLYTTTGSPRLTQVAQPSAVSANAQDGTGAAQLLHVNLADGGDLVATYSNGQTETVGRLALAAIRNPATLSAVGNNNFQVSQQTALPTIGEADAGGRGQVVAASLESSTVDIAREFTNLIIYQRGYEANAKVITTEEQLGQTTNNLKQ